MRRSSRIPTRRVLLGSEPTTAPARKKPRATATKKTRTTATKKTRAKKTHAGPSTASNNGTTHSPAPSTANNNATTHSPAPSTANNNATTNSRAPAASTPPRSSPLATIVWAPGAGGRTSKAAIQLLEALQDAAIAHVHRLDAGGAAVGWNKMNPAAPKNIAFITSACQSLAQGSNARIILAGASFGCRVVCEVVAELGPASEGLGIQPQMVLCGFPLFPPGDAMPVAKRDRTRHLKALPGRMKPLFVSGTEDEFLLRSYLVDEPEDVLKNVVAECCPAESSFCILAGGKHSVPDVRGGKAAQQAAVQQVAAAIAALLNEK